MMKKLLVLALVLSMAVVANAGLSMTYDSVNGKFKVSDDAALLGGINAGIGVTLNGSNSGMLTLVNGAVAYRTLADKPEGTPATYWLPVATPAAYVYTAEDVAPGSTTSNAWELPYNAGFVNIVWGDSETDINKANPAGFWFSLTDIRFNGLLVGTENDPWVLKIDVADGSGVSQGSMYLTPEPMTMLLLGLGGLFLRRK